MTTKLRRGRVKTKASPATRRRRGTVRAPEGRRGTGSPNARDASAHCSLLPDIAEELQGSYLDATAALRQVLDAFFVSSNDIHRAAGTIRDARDKLAVAYSDHHERRCYGE